MESTPNPDPIVRNNSFRRKARRFQGADWTPPTMSADHEDGLYCRACHQWHGYKLGLNVAYEKRGKVWVILWSCKKTGNVVGETYLEGGLPQEEDNAGTDS